jgi:hypothetical protein
VLDYPRLFQIELPEEDKVVVAQQGVDPGCGRRLHNVFHRHNLRSLKRLEIALRS